MAKEPDLWLVGLGLHWRQITLEARETLSRCRVVFLQGGDPLLESHLAEAGPKPRPLRFERRPSFTEDQERRQEERLSEVFEELKNGGPVAVALPGSPLFLDGIAALLVRGCRERGVSFGVVDGVSSFDAVIRSLGADLLGRGVQVVDASALLRGWPLDPRQPALVFRPVAPCLPAGTTPRRVLELLAQRLAPEYPEGHRVLWIAAGQDGSEAIECPLAELPKKAAWAESRQATLLVPAAGVAPGG